uniref:Guanine nucleotide exchange factor MSS4 homolog n=1 Tax=Caenorhabditis tropicalis TaxID=1561998 RepID=A0A1I7TE38_9PELO
MSSSSLSLPSASMKPLEKEENNGAVEAKTNEETLVCKICQTVVILKNMTTEWLNEERELPLPRQKKGIDHTQTEPVRGYFGVKDIFAFENVGFTRSSEGKRFLVCGECEQGPVGYVDPETEMNYVTPERLDVLQASQDGKN